VNLIRYRDRPGPSWSCAVERWDYQVKTGNFMPFNVSALDLDRKAARTTPGR
jgi:hypothetical protein